MLTWICLFTYLFKQHSNLGDIVVIDNSHRVVYIANEIHILTLTVKLFNCNFDSLTFVSKNIYIIIWP